MAEPSVTMAAVSATEMCRRSTMGACRRRSGVAASRTGAEGEWRRVDCFCCGSSSRHVTARSLAAGVVVGSPKRRGMTMGRSSTWRERGLPVAAFDGRCVHIQTRNLLWGKRRLNMSRAINLLLTDCTRDTKHTLYCILFTPNDIFSKYRLVM